MKDIAIGKLEPGSYVAVLKIDGKISARVFGPSPDSAIGHMVCEHPGWFGVGAIVHDYSYTPGEEKKI